MPRRFDMWLHLMPSINHGHGYYSINASYRQTVYSGNGEREIREGTLIPRDDFIATCHIYDVAYRNHFGCNIMKAPWLPEVEGTPPPHILISSSELLLYMMHREVRPHIEETGNRVAVIEGRFNFKNKGGSIFIGPIIE